MVVWHCQLTCIVHWGSLLGTIIYNNFVKLYQQLSVIYMPAYFDAVASLNVKRTCKKNHINKFRYQTIAKPTAFENILLLFVNAIHTYIALTGSQAEAILNKTDYTRTQQSIHKVQVFLSLMCLPLANRSYIYYFTRHVYVDRPDNPSSLPVIL